MDYRKEIEDLVDLILKEGASDLHLASGRTPIIRVSGNLIPLMKKPILSDADMKGFINIFLGEDNKIILESRILQFLILPTTQDIPLPSSLSYFGCGLLFSSLITIG